jgi:hypothetical protein
MRLEISAPRFEHLNVKRQSFPGKCGVGVSKRVVCDRTSPTARCPTRSHPAARRGGTRTRRPSAHLSSTIQVSAFYLLGTQGDNW